MKHSQRLGVVVFSGLLSLVLCSGGSVFAAVKKGKSEKKAPKKQEGKVLFDFELDVEGWRIPDWAFEKSDNASVEVNSSPEFASAGKKSLKLTTKFPPKMWSGAYVEIEQDSSGYMDFSSFPYLYVDVYLPATAPKKLKGEIILTVGDAWAWTEMRQAVELTPGAWTVLQANVTPESTAWKSRLTSSLVSDVRKLGVRVSLNQGSYDGPVFIDNVRLGPPPAK